MNNETVTEKKRHGCLTVYLVLMLLSNSIYGCGSFMVTTSPDSEISEIKPPNWSFILIGILCLINLVSTFAILKWKKWGFWLFILTAIFTMFFNIYFGATYASAVLGLVGVAILYGVLQIGGDKKGWTQLE